MNRKSGTDLDSGDGAPKCGFRHIDTLGHIETEKRPQTTETYNYPKQEGPAKLFPLQWTTTAHIYQYYVQTHTRKEHGQPLLSFKSSPLEMAFIMINKQAMPF